MRVKSFAKQRASELGFQAVGITSAWEFAATEQVMLQRVERGVMAGLSWFTPARARLSCHPEELLPGAKSIVTLAASYLTPGPALPDEATILRGRVARYAWGKDYHDVLRARLRALVDDIAKELGYHPNARMFVDSSPLAERAAAQRSGLGWFGKNTNILVHGLGSWAFLAAIILDVELREDEPLLTHCGSCDLCLQACPTGALLDPYTLDNTRCISYQTIENRGSIPRDLRSLMGDWVYGCDVCQDVCPVNRKALTASWEEFQPASAESVRPELVSLLEMDAPTYQKRFRGSAMKRAKRGGLQRNAAVALGNAADPSAGPALERALESPDGIVRSHVAWAMGRIGGKRARAALETARRKETEPAVRQEVETALQAL